MKSRLKLAVYEAAENGTLGVNDAAAYLDFIECADLNDAEDVDVLTEMVDTLAGGEAYYESAEEAVLSYLVEAKEAKKENKLKEKIDSLKAGKKKEAGSGKAAKLKEALAKNKKKIAVGAGTVAGLAGTGAAAYLADKKLNGGKGAAAVKNATGTVAQKIASLRKKKGDDVDTSYVDTFGETTESVADLIYESVEAGDITVTEAAELLEMLD